MLTPTSLQCENGEVAAFFREPMELTLTYRGPLPSGQNNSRKRLQMSMRREFHDQLTGVWRTWAFLKDSTRLTFGRTQVGEFSFVPLVATGHALKLVCELKIKLLSRDEPGSIVHRGDLDNRLKVLFDALTVPQSNQLPDDAVPASRENPFLCLLDDDKLITALAVQTATLFRSAAAGEPKNYVELDITANVRTSEKSTAALRL
jgi:hypothetical protein